MCRPPHGGRPHGTATRARVAGAVEHLLEPYRVSRRLQTLRIWSHETEKQLFPAATGNSGAVHSNDAAPIRSGSEIPSPKCGALVAIDSAPHNRLAGVVRAVRRRTFSAPSISPAVFGHAVAFAVDPLRVRRSDARARSDPRSRWHGPQYSRLPCGRADRDRSGSIRPHRLHTASAAGTIERRTRRASFLDGTASTLARESIQLPSTAYKSQPRPPSFGSAYATQRDPSSTVRLRCLEISSTARDVTESRRPPRSECDKREPGLDQVAQPVTTLPRQPGPDSRTKQISRSTVARKRHAPLALSGIAAQVAAAVWAEDSLWGLLTGTAPAAAWYYFA